MRYDPSIGAAWQRTFIDRLRAGGDADALKSASLEGRLKPWTALLTKVAVGSCVELGWVATAKGHMQPILLGTNQEYLALDVMAFEPGKAAWPFPIAVFELENSRDPHRVAFSLWKTLCVNAPLRIVFCYRKKPEEGTALIGHLRREVLDPLTPSQRQALAGETWIVQGTRGEAEAFPYGFFKWWMLDPQTGNFRLT